MQYSLQFDGKTYYFSNLSQYHDYLLDYPQKEAKKGSKTKHYPRLSKREVLNLFLVEFTEATLDHLETEDQKEMAETY